jgi:hypothetical protein
LVYKYNVRVPHCVGLDKKYVKVPHCVGLAKKECERVID